MAIDIKFGRESFTLQVEPERVIEARREHEPVASANVAQLVEEAVSTPTRFPALHLALTPDDHVAVVIDDWRHLAAAEAAILGELRQAGIPDKNVTFVGPQGIEPPEVQAEYKAEQHDPNDAQHRCYVATTENGRRVYLNRTVVEADQVVVLAEVRFDAERGTAGGPLAIFPDMADTESQDGLKALSPADLREAAEEVCWLLGTVFYVHLIAGPGNTTSQVIGGGPDSYADARSTLRSLWKVSTSARADIAIATFAAVGDQISMNELVRALASGVRAVKPGGTVVLCIDGAPRLTPTFQDLSNYDSPEAALLSLKRSSVEDGAVATRWLKSVGKVRVTILSDWTEDVAEGLFATALTKATQVQKVVDRGGTVVVLPEAHRSRIATIDEE